MQQLVTKGKKDIDETDKALARAERIVEDTKDVGKTVSKHMCIHTGTCMRMHGMAACNCPSDHRRHRFLL